MRKLVIGLIAVLLLVSVSCSQACEPVPEPAPILPTPSSAPTPTIIFPSDWTEIQTSLKPGEIYRVNVFAEINDIIEYSWKADYNFYGVYFWYTTPRGLAMVYDTPITSPPEPYRLGQDISAFLGVGDTFSIAIDGRYRDTGYYTFCFVPRAYSVTEPAVGITFRYRVGKWTVQESQSASPPTQEPQPTSVPTTSRPTGISPSDIANTPSTYDGKEVELSGQTYLTGSPPKLLIDGKSGINLAGNTANLQKGFYRMKGLYDAGTNTLNVTEAVKEEVEYTAIEAGKELGISLIVVAVQGLVATPPKEVANALTSYLSIPSFPKDVPVYPYVVYGKDGFYLALSDTLIDLPARFTFLYQGKDYSFTFSAGEVKGTLIKTPLEKINFGPGWAPGEFGGVIIADTIASMEAEDTTVKEINANPGNFIFKRVSINGSYIVTTATVDYSDIKAPMGQGILADEFSDFFKEDTKARLETIDPNTKVWQLRRGEVVGTVIYPTDQILRYFDYSAPLSQSEVKQRMKPALIVDTLVDEVEEVTNISELNPALGRPSQYWGKVVEFDGYALGINYPSKQVAKAILNTEVPVNVNLLAVSIADKPAIGSQIAIIGLNNDLIGEQGEIIIGKYKFKVAVTHMPEELVSGVPGADTAFFLLSKEELPIEIPTPELYSLNVSISPPGAG